MSRGSGWGGAKHKVDGVGLGGNGFAGAVRKEEVAIIKAVNQTVVMHAGLGI